MSFINYKIEPAKYNAVKGFIEKWHYSHSTKGLKIYQCFGLFNIKSRFGLPELEGALIYAFPAMPNPPKKYNPSNPKLCIELSRLVCVDSAPKNIESWFIAYTLRWLKNNSPIQMVISYADPRYGHTGIIYKASNFKLVGRTGSKRSIIVDGKAYHERALTEYSGIFYDKLRERIKNNDAGIKILKTEPKYIYTYKL